jgi:glycosyltransferase involved in cell wall biosynthesis
MFADPRRPASAPRRLELPPPIQVLHITTTLGLGGAQMMLTRLVVATERRRVEPSVLSLVRDGVLAPRVKAAGVPLHDLGMRQGMPTPNGVLRLAALARDLSPDIVQGWMYHGNVVATLYAQRARGRLPVVWNVRHSLHEIQKEKPIRRLLIRLGAKMSRSTAAIIYNSRVAARQHQDLGYAASKTIVIPNGFDCDLFRPRIGAREQLRQIVGIPARSIVLGQIARGHPMKDSEGLIRAVRLLVDAGLDLHLVLVGRKLDHGNHDLVRAIRETCLADRVSLLGSRDDIPQIAAGLDIFVSASAWGEAFPNALGEAMASAISCITTDVGDSAWVLDGNGMVVPPRQPEALAAAIRRLVELGAEVRHELGARARARVLAEFSLPQIARQYTELHERLVGRERPAAAA